LELLGYQAASIPASADVISDDLCQRVSF
jgi:hypothetical protein